MRFENIKEFIEYMDKQQDSSIEVGMIEAEHILTEEDYNNHTEDVYHYQVVKSKKKLSDLDTMSGEQFINWLRDKAAYVVDYDSDLGAMLDDVKNGKSYKEIFIETLKVYNCGEYSYEFGEYLYDFEEIYGLED